MLGGSLGNLYLTHSLILLDMFVIIGRIDWQSKKLIEKLVFRIR